MELWFQHCITVAAEIGHAVVDMKLEVKCESVLIHYQTSKNNLEVSTFLLMISLSNIIIQTEIYPIETETLIEDHMALVFAKLIFCFQNVCRWMELWFHYCITVAAVIGHAALDLKLEVKCEPVLIHYQTSKN